MKYRVFRQDKPINTGEVIHKGQPDTWFKPNLVEVGIANSFEDARKLTPYPIVEAIGGAK